MSAVPPQSVFPSAVTEAELRYGLAKLPAATRLKILVESFLSVVKILPWDSQAASEYGFCARAWNARVWQWAIWI